MGKARIHGSNAVIKINGKKIGEVDKFSAKRVDELKKSQPLGEIEVTSQVIHKGWELSFEGGKVDWATAAVLHRQEELIMAGKRSPHFTVEQEISYFDGKREVWTYSDVSIHGYEIDMPIEEITEKFSGFSGKNRTKTTGGDQPTSASDDVATILKNILGS